MPDPSPTLLYRSLDERRLAVFIGDRVAADELYAFHRRLADFILRYEVATVVLSATDPDLLQSFDEFGAGFDHIVTDADLAAMQPDQPTLFSLAGLTDARPLTATAYDQLAAAADRPQLLAVLRQRLAGQTVVCYGVDPAQAWSLPAVSGWPGVDADQPLFLVWEQAIDALDLPAHVLIIAHDPFDLLHEPEYQAAMDDDGQSKGADDVDFDPHHDDSSPGDRPPSPPPPPDESMRLRAETLRIDAAVPERVEVNRAFVLAVAVRQLTSPRLAEDDLSVMASGEAQVVFEGEGPIHLRLRVSAPDCKIDGADAFSFRLWPGKDSPSFHFNLTPARTGAISIVIQLFQEDDFLGSSRLATQAESEPASQAELAGRAELAGQVEMLVMSQPLSAPSDQARRQIEETGAQRKLANILLDRLKANLALLTAGAQKAEVEAQIVVQESLVKELERRLDELMQPG